MSFNILFPTTYHLITDILLQTKYKLTFIKDHNSIFECKICDKVFQNADAYDTLCGHTYHRKCMIDYIVGINDNNKGSIYCPECNINFELYSSNNKLIIIPMSDDKDNCVLCLDPLLSTTIVKTICLHKAHLECVSELYRCNKNKCFACEECIYL